jgi:hypothetical protein
MGVGQMAQLEAQYQSRPRHKRKHYNNSLTPTKIRATLAAAAATPTPSHFSDSTEGYAMDERLGTPADSLLTPTTTRSSHGGSLSSIPIGCDSASIYKPAFAVPITSCLLEPQLQQEEPLDQIQVKISQANRSLHDFLDGSHAKATVQPNLWLHYNRDLDLHTPGISLISGFLYTTKIVPEERDNYMSKSVSVDDLPLIFDQMVSFFIFVYRSTLTEL